MKFESGVLMKHFCIQLVHMSDFCTFQEIVNIYPSINPPTLTAHQSNRYA